MNDISALYHPSIIAHNRSPRQFFIPDDYTDMIEAYNPICGDQYKIYMRLRGQSIEMISFHGYGCAVSKAAISMLVERIKIQELSQASNLLKQYLSFMSGATTLDDPELRVFQKANQFPGRGQCASLGADALSQFFFKKM